MALPRSYLTSSKNLASMFEAIKSAQAPEKFTLRFLESLDFKSVADRLFIGVLKSLGFLRTDSAQPTERYFKFLDQTQSAQVLAEGIREAYKDLFQVNKNANTLSKSDVVNKMKTLSQGQFSESVLDKMSMTFSELCKLADFSTRPPPETRPVEIEKEEPESSIVVPHAKTSVNFGGLNYVIQIVLPESRDPKIYDSIFKSLREHLVG